MITRKNALSPITLAIAVMLVLMAALAFSISVRQSTPLISYNDDGSRMSVHANVFIASDGVQYRVTITTHYEPRKEVVRIVDMYSLGDKYASITGIMRSDLGSWNELYSCSRDEIKAEAPCPHNDFVAERLLNEALRKIMVRENTIGNLEVLWSWEVRTKEIISQIKN